MAVKNEDGNKNADYLSICSMSLSENMRNFTNSDSILEFVIQKRNKKNWNGDFIAIPLGYNKNCSTTDHKELKSSCKFEKVKVTNDVEIGVANIQQQAGGSYLLKLNRSELFLAIIKDIVKLKEEFGRFTQHQAVSAVVNTSFLHDVELGCDTWELTLSHLRSLLLAQHTAALLGASGFKTGNLLYKHLPLRCTGICDTLGIQLTSIQVDTDLDIAVTSSLRQFLTSSPFYKNENISSYGENTAFLGNNQRSESFTSCELNDKQSAKTEQQTANKVNCTRHSLNLKEVISERNLTTGKDGYDSNIHIVDFSEGSSRFQHLCTLEYNIQHLLPEKPDVCVHVTSYEQSYSQQAVDLAWQALSERAASVRQVHLFGGPVSARKSPSSSQQLPSTHEFFELRKRQMKESFCMKYGNRVQGEGWEATIEALTAAVIKFDFLSTNNKSPLKLDLSADHHHGLEKGGVFVMYNCARLATLFRSFEEAVSAGTYPPMPPVDTLDFTCLREEEEWVLMFNYLFMYPNVVASCMSAVKDGKPRPLIHTHKICQFLVDLSRDFSTYYNRIHVLGEPRSHLLEVMYARIHLLRSVQQVMHNALALLHIQPLSQL